MLNEKIKVLREAHKMTKVELAKKFNISKQTVSNWESGYISPSITKLIMIAEFFNVTTDFLLDLDNNNKIDVSGLNDMEISYISHIVSEFKKQHK